MGGRWHGVTLAFDVVLEDLLQGLASHIVWREAGKMAGVENTQEQDEK